VSILLHRIVLVVGALMFLSVCTDDLEIRCCILRGYLIVVLQFV
jgi:hypothetical protein